MKDYGDKGLEELNRQHYRAKANPPDPSIDLRTPLVRGAYGSGKVLTATSFALAPMMVINWLTRDDEGYHARDLALLHEAWLPNASLAAQIHAVKADCDVLRLPEFFATDEVLLGARF